MELVITYSPSGKTKYFGVALETGEILAARSKKAALHVIETLIKYVKNASRDDVGQEPIVVDSTIDSDHNSSEHVSHPDSGTAETSISTKGADHPTVDDLKKKSDTIYRLMDVRNSELAESIKQGKRRVVEIQQIRDELSSILPGDFGDNGEWITETSVSQQLHHERPMRRITQDGLPPTEDFD